MDDNIKDLWRIIYEIEGLVLLAENKSENLPYELISLIKEKIVSFQDVIDNLDAITCTNQLRQTINKQEPNVNHEDFPTEIDEVITDNIPQELSSNFDLQETEVIESDDITIDENHYDSVFIDESESIEVVNDEIEVIEMEAVELSEKSDNGIEISIKTLEEKLTRQNSKDLKHAFTINDKYRFRRELFGNSDTEFIDMINLVSAMTSLTEAEEYFYGDLEWDQENEEVRDFMNIIALYFAD
ncbi:MAG: hypothetical protein IJN66_06480 [Muribaculaceae bacterium]|nr:hypothetical protein [Muribaculaceae bacterium]